VTGVDPSIKMLELARQRLGEGAVLHYLRDWKAPLAELRRVLAPGGRLIVAVNHPFGYKLQYPDEDYFAACEYSEEYENLFE
jgi:ubiquinone/menaquinone biosynthesis C-methylase UbiE